MSPISVDLPLPVRPTSAARWPGSTDEAHVVEDRLLRRVSEPHVRELDAALEWRRRPGPGAVADLALDVQDLGDALEADRRLRQRVRHLREVLHRLVHLAQVEDEDEQGPGGQTAFEHESDAEPEHETGADRDDDVDERGQARLDAARAQTERDAFLTLLDPGGFSSKSSLANALTTRTDEIDSWTTDASSLSFCLTARAAFLMRRVKR